MKDHPHLRGAAESYNSLKEAFLQSVHLSKMMGATAAQALDRFCLTVGLSNKLTTSSTD